MKKHPQKSYFWSVAQGCLFNSGLHLTHKTVFIELKVPFLTKILVCWVFSGQKESKPNSNPKTYNQEAKVAFIAPSRSVLFSPLTSHTQISAAAQLHECQAMSTKKVCVPSAVVHDCAPSAYAAEPLAASYYTFSSRENVFQTIDFFFFTCAMWRNYFTCVQVAPHRWNSFPYEAEGLKDVGFRLGVLCGIQASASCGCISLNHWLMPKSSPFFLSLQWLNSDEEWRVTKGGRKHWGEALGRLL